MSEFESKPTDDGGYVVGPYEQDPTPEGVVPGYGIPTQIAYPLRAILRTVIQSGVGFVLAWLARSGVEFTDPNVASVLVDTITAAVWVGGTALATWIMTRPAIAAALSKTAIAPVPRRAI